MQQEMNQVTTELLQYIVSYLPCSDLCALRLTCKGFSVLVAPYTFELLQLSARPDQLTSPIVRPLSLSHSHWDERVGRSRITSYSDLRAVVKIVIPAIAPLVKTLIFSPGWFRPGQMFPPQPAVTLCAYIN